MSNPKRLGNQFEREIARKLSRWVWEAVHEDEPYNGRLIFWRVGSSGAVGTLTGKQEMHGDIVAIDPLGVPVTNRFNFELKRRKKFNLFSLMTESHVLKELTSWYKEAKITGFYPLLIVKVIRIGTFLITDASTLAEFFFVCGGYPFPYIGCKSCLMYEFGIDEDLYILDFEKFLDWTKPYVKLLVKSYQSKGVDKK